MCQSMLYQNIDFLRGSDINYFDNEALDENILHYIANSLTDINYQLDTNDIIFTYSLQDDIKRVKRSTVDSNISKNEDEWIKDPTRQLDTVRLGILTKSNLFFEYAINLDNNQTGHIYFIGISRLHINSVHPQYPFYKQSDDPHLRKYKELDHLNLIFDEIQEVIRLYGHSHISNKSLREISRELFSRLN